MDTLGGVKVGHVSGASMLSAWMGNCCPRPEKRAVDKGPGPPQWAWVQAPALVQVQDALVPEEGLLSEEVRASVRARGMHHT